MIFDTPSLSLPLKIKADLCVIGCGAGGGMVAMLAAQAGMKVVVLEAGPFLTPSDMNQREESMFPKLYWDSGGRTTADHAIRIHQGRGIGGSTLHNLNLCKRIPDSILQNWEAKFKLESLTSPNWGRLYQEVEKLLNVTTIPKSMQNQHNRLLEKGCHDLGWSGGMLNYNRTGCIGSGFCELGCAYDAKNNVCKVLVPEAVKAGAEFFSYCQATRILHCNGKIEGVEALALDHQSYRPIGKVSIQSRKVCLSASATGSAALILRSQIPHPQNSVGHNLHIHPGVIAIGEFSHEVRAWEGVPQSYECTQFLNFDTSQKNLYPNRLWIVPAFAHPMGAALMLPGYGKSHSSLMARYGHIAVFSAMLHDHTTGLVYPNGDLGLGIEYQPHTDDLQELRYGLKACAQLLFAAGAIKVMIPCDPLLEFKNPEELEKINHIVLAKYKLDITAVHPMGTVPMGDDPATAAVDSHGCYHHIQGLWIADGSLFPSSIGVPPQLSIYALGLHVGQHLINQD